MSSGPTGRQAAKIRQLIPLIHIYNWFIEGFGTADLKDAKFLLDSFA